MHWYEEKDEDKVAYFAHISKYKLSRYLSGEIMENCKNFCYECPGSEQSMYVVPAT
jgi:hypothetical protein